MERGETAVLIGLVFAVGAVAHAGTAQDLEGQEGVLHTAVYEAGALGHSAAGSVVWLGDDAGNLRVEIVRQQGQPRVDLDALAWQRGRGWSLVLPADAPGTVNAWAEEWRRAPEGVADAVRLTIAALTAPTDPPGAGTEESRAVGAVDRWRAGRGLPRVERRPVGSLSEADRGNGFRWRDRQVATGLGRGPGGEVLVLVRQRFLSSTDAERLEARFSGRPGRVWIWDGRSYFVTYYAPEVFVPLWPLGDSLQSLP